MGSCTHEIFAMSHVTLVTGCRTTESYIVLHMEHRAHKSRDNVTRDSGNRIQTMGCTHSDSTRRQSMPLLLHRSYKHIHKEYTVI